MTMNHPFQRFIGWATGSTKAQFQRAHEANDIQVVRDVVRNVLGHRDFQAIQAGPPSAILRVEGVNPALWGDLVLQRGTSEDIDAFGRAGGLVLDRYGADGKRPSDHLAARAYYSHGLPQWGETIKCIHAAERLGVTFDSEALQQAAPVRPFIAYRGGLPIATGFLDGRVIEDLKAELTSDVPQRGFNRIPGDWSPF